MPVLIDGALIAGTCNTLAVIIPAVNVSVDSADDVIELDVRRLVAVI